VSVGQYPATLAIDQKPGSCGSPFILRAEGILDRAGDLHREPVGVLDHVSGCQDRREKRPRDCNENKRGVSQDIDPMLLNEKDNARLTNKES
jgi:hypothetical protein